MRGGCWWLRWLGRRWRSEMGQIVWCRHCAMQYERIAGSLPDECPDCKQPGLWTTEPMPKVPWRLHYQDQVMLRRLRIDPEADD